MRIFLITVQAAILSLVAVIGAHGDTDNDPNCPVTVPVAIQSCAE